MARMARESSDCVSAVLLIRLSSDCACTTETPGANLAAAWNILFSAARLARIGRRSRGVQSSGLRAGGAKLAEVTPMTVRWIPLRLSVLPMMAESDPNARSHRA